MGCSITHIAINPNPNARLQDALFYFEDCGIPSKVINLRNLTHVNGDLNEESVLI